MFISFLLPYNIRHTKAPFLWVFYKQLSSFNDNEVFYIGNEDYFKYPHIYQDRDELSNMAQIGQGYEIPNDKTIDNINKSIIENDIFLELEEKFDSYEDIYKFLLLNRYKPLEDKLEQIISNLIKNYSVEAILSWCNMPSLQFIANRYNLKVIYNELGPIRKNEIFKLGFAYFDFSGVNGNTEAKKRFESISLDKNKLLSNEEILALILNTKYLPSVLYKEKPLYEVGIVLQVEDDSNILAYSDGLDNVKLISLVKERFKKEDILIRPHPGGSLNYDKYGNIDDSKNSMEFIKKCKRVVTINSSVAIEAILLNKPTYILGESPLSFLAYNKLDISLENRPIENLKEKLNFIIFNYLIPRDFLFLDEYYKFRLTNPTENEIYKYHINYLNSIYNIEIKPQPVMESVIFKKYIEKYNHLVNEQLQEKDNVIKNLTNIINENNIEIENLNKIVKDKEVEVKKLNDIIKNLEEHKQLLIKELDNVYNSKRWKLFYPIDKIREKKLLKLIYIYVKSNRILRLIYHKLPLSNEAKWKIRQFISTGNISQQSKNDLVEDDLNIDISHNCNDKPLVSVVIPCYNQGEYLWESISSAYASYNGNVEIIVINDGSTNPRTIKALDEIKVFFPKVFILDKENGGLSSARNAGIKKATGEYIQFLDADDILAPGKIDVQICNITDKNSILISNYLTSDESCKTFFKTEETIKGYSFDLDDFLFKWERGLSIPIHCGLFPKKVFDEVEFDIELTAKEDWFMWTTLVQKGYQITYIDVHSVVYRVHTESMVRRSFVKMSKQWEKAYTKIASLIDAQKRDEFLKESGKWLENYYRANPNYKKELGLDKVVQDEKILQVLTEDKDKTEKLLQSFHDFGSDNPVISVVVPVFNHYDYLFKCFQSVTNQGDVPIELICVNDNSSDKRVETLLNKMQKLKNITIIQHDTNKGISYTQNEAVKVANGKYIAFLDCDDFLKEKALEIVYEKIKQLPNIDYFFTDRTNIDKNNNILYDAIYKVVKSKNEVKSDLLDRMIASHLKVIKKSIYEKVGGSDKKMSGIQDWDLALKIAEIGELKYIDKLLYFHRLHENSVTSSDSVAQLKKTNILRRQFAKRWLNRTTDDIDMHNIADIQDLNYKKDIDNIKIFSPENLNLNTWYCPDDIKEAFKNNQIIVFNARGKLNSIYVEFLKDFNSYFDLILCDRLSISSQLIGALWSEKIIWTPLKQCK